MIVKGQLSYQKWQKGKRLTRKGAIEAQCYICNGQESGAVDCQGESTCPLYPYFHYRSK